jgi:uracil-DNA glycosylase
MSEISRDVILREIGLTPIWRVRNTEAAAHDAPAESAVVATDDATRAATRARDYDEFAIAEQPPVVSENDEASRAARIATLDWDALDDDIAQCTACKLCKTRTNTVPGVGNRNPEWMVIGEGPGENEDKQGEPFVGRAGQLLDQMLAAVQMSRKENVFIANVVKCRPPGNRDPEADEIEACAPYLERQIALAKPKLLLAVGKFAGQKVLNTDATVGAMRAAPGKRGDIPVVVTYHPAYLLRSPLEKAKAWSDLVAAKRLTETLNKSHAHVVSPGLGDLEPQNSST